MLQCGFEVAQKGSAKKLAYDSTQYEQSAQRPLILLHMQKLCLHYLGVEIRNEECEDTSNLAGPTEHLGS